MTRTIILGGGFGGIACARALRARLGPPHAITVIDRAPDFVVGATKTWVAIGARTAREVARPRATLLPPGVDCLESEVRRIDVARREVATDRGALQADHLVVALGTTLDMDQVPGLAEAARTFYTLDGAISMSEALAAFRGGRLVLLIPRIPFACPPGPYEALLLLHDLLERRGLRASTQLEVWTVEKSPMATAGAEMGRAIVGLLDERGIGHHFSMKASKVDAAAREIHFEGGARTAYDLLIAIPPHRAPDVVVEGGLAEPAGWIPVDPATFEVKSAGAPKGVYAIGDVTGVGLPGRWDPSVPLSLPKAGVFAAAHGEVVAAGIAASVEGRAATERFDGKGFCYVELGEGRAMRADGDFFATPNPVMRARVPDESQYRDKIAWIESLLKPVR